MTRGEPQARVWTEAVLGIPPEQRSTYLAGVCADPDVRRAIERLAGACERNPALADSIALGAASTSSTTMEPIKDFTLQPGQQIGRYVIETTLGRGGMGEVYLAHDRTLDRRVALKALVRRGSESQVRNIVREAHAVAQLNHPGIAAVYDVVEHEGRAFIVMEFVPGQTLAQHAASKPLASAEIIDIARQLAVALDHAHRAGIVHCDLKPANIKVTGDGAVKILDFGIARVTSQSRGGSSGTSATTLDAIAGTPAYMSPEQWIGGRLDARSDLFSFGVILYELSAGVRPFQADDPISLALAVLTQPCPDPPETVSTPLRTVIARCLEKDPEARFQSAGEIVEALRKSDDERGDARRQAAPISRSKGWIAAAASAAAVAGLMAMAVPWLSSRHQSRADVVVVLPFSSAGSDGAAVATGLADLFETDLSSVPGLVVIPRAASLKYPPAPGSYPKVRADLGADLAISGEVSRRQNAIGASLALIRLDTGSMVWTRRFSGTADGLLEMERQMAAAVAAQLGHEVSTARGGAGSTLGSASAHALDMQAFEDYARGRAFLDRPDDGANIDRALKLFESAVERDRGFALAHAAIGEASWLKYSLTKDARWTEKARDATLEALRLDPSQPRVRYSLAVIYQGTGRREDAVEELLRASQAQPWNDEFHRLLGRVYSEMNRTDEAITQLTVARGLRPGFWDTYRALGLIYYRVGRYDEAITAFKRATELQPDSNSGFQMLGTAYHAKGDLENALASYRKANAIKPSATAWNNIGMISHQQRRFADAVAAYRQSIQLSPNEPTTFRNLGDAYARVPDAKNATGAYKHAIQLITKDLLVNPTNANEIALEALCQAKLGRFTEAIPLAAHAASLAPKSGAVRYRQAVVETLGGRFNEATAALQAAIENGSSRQLAREDEDLVRLRQLPGVVEILREP